VAPAFNEPELGHGDVGAVASAYGPPAVTASELIETADAPVFLNPIECVTLVVPTATLPKFNAVSETVV